ncbi:MAG: short-chain dehydrogenase [Acidimicrobiaceae bacterium]|nr:short-chain dehydrogenase [Acidimicrobiaceae bacterium]
MDRFQGKCVFLTGASTGIGRATSKRLASEGASLYLVDVNQEELEKTVKECSEHNTKVQYAICDVSNEKDVSDAIHGMVCEFGGINTVINVAGIQIWQHSHKHSLEDFERTLAVNLTGTFLVCREALPHLLKEGGSIINTSSTTALAGIPYSAAYAASKAGVLALTKSLAVEYGKQGLQVNCINPGGIKTAMSKMPPIEEPNMDLLLRQSPLANFADPESVAGLIAYLASSEARHINGESIRIDGGALA